MRKLIISDDQFKAIKYALSYCLSKFNEEEQKTEVFKNYQNAYRRINNAEYVEDIIKKSNDEAIMNFLQERL